MANNDYETEMREQEQDGWDDDMYYNEHDDDVHHRDDGLDVGFGSWEEVNSQFYSKY